MSKIPNIPETRIPLRLSTMLWTGEPQTIDFDWGQDEEGYVGTYSSGPSPSLVPHGWSSSHNAYEYRTSQPTRFAYTRKIFVGHLPPNMIQCGRVVANALGPRFQLHQACQRSFPKFQSFKHSDGTAIAHNGPPFFFFETDYSRDGADGLEPQDIGGLELKGLDLPGQVDDDDVEEDRIDVQDPENEGLTLRGWRGDWADRLLETQDIEQPLGTRRVVRWMKGKGCRTPTWGIELDLEALQLTESTFVAHDVSRPRRAIESYKVRATIVRIFITPEWFDSKVSIIG